MARVPPAALQCVGFVGSRPDKNAGPISLRGTVFFVARAIGGVPGKFVQFAVTARHVLDGIRAKGHFLFLRLTTALLIGEAKEKFPISAWQIVSLDDWVEHPDRSVDATIMPLPLFEYAYDMDHIFPGMTLTTDVINEFGVGVGDEVFMTGLFVNRPGDLINIPIVRVGNIAAMPEKVYTGPAFGDMHAYLIEARSIGGLSGSPAFVNLGTTRTRANNQVARAVSQYGSIYWMGLVHGHFDGNVTELDAGFEDSVEKQRERVNMGIAIVVPSEKILEIFNEPKLVKFESDVAQAGKAMFGNDIKGSDGPST